MVAPWPPGKTHWFLTSNSSLYFFHFKQTSGGVFLPISTPPATSTHQNPVASDLPSTCLSWLTWQKRSPPQGKFAPKLLGSGDSWNPKIWDHPKHPRSKCRTCSFTSQLTEMVHDVFYDFFANRLDFQKNHPRIEFNSRGLPELPSEGLMKPKPPSLRHPGMCWTVTIGSRFVMYSRDVWWRFCMHKWALKCAFYVWCKSSTQTSKSIFPWIHLPIHLTGSIGATSVCTDPQVHLCVTDLYSYK